MVLFCLYFVSLALLNDLWWNVMHVVGSNSLELKFFGKVDNSVVSV